MKVLLLFVVIASVLTNQNATAQSLGTTEQSVSATGGFGGLFGVSVDVDNQFAVIGAPNDGESISWGGAAYIFERDSEGVWNQVIKLDPDSLDDMWFGNSVAIEGNHVLVSAVFANTGEGRIYAYARDEFGIWNLTQTFTASQGENYFGASIAISDGRAIIATALPFYSNDDSPKSTYFFEIDEFDIWHEVSRIPIPERDFEGTDVAIDGDYAAVGSAYIGASQNRVITFKRQNDGTWLEHQSLVGASHEGFGESVDIDNGILAVGIPFDFLPTVGNPGSVRVYLLNDDGNWQGAPLIVANDRGNRDEFGSSVAVKGDYIFVGAGGDDENGQDSGALYVFKRQEDGLWTQVEKVLASNGAPGDFLGGDAFFSSILATDGNTVIIGAAGKDDGQGAAYFFECDSTHLIVPVSVSITRGTLLAGEFSDVNDSDDVDLSIARNSADAVSRVFVEVESLSPTPTPSTLSFTLEAAIFARSSVTQSIDLFNYQTQQFEEVDARPAQRFSDLVTEVDALGDLSRFVEPGTLTIKARSRFQSANMRQQFSANIDQMIWAIQ